jgi:hypothetical protein
MGGFVMSLHVQVFHPPHSSNTVGPANTVQNHKVESERRRRKSRFTALSLAIAVATLATIGCAKAPEHPWVVRDGLIEVETYNQGQLFVKRDHHLGRYDDLMIEEVGFRWGPGEERLQDLDEDRIVAMLEAAIEGSPDGSVGTTTSPGPCVLAVNFYLKDLELRSPDWHADSTTSFVSSYGAATMVLELRDSIGREPLARFVQRRTLGGGREVLRRGASLDRLGQVISMSLRDMGNQIKKTIPPSTGVAANQCNGGMANIVLGQR